MKTKQIEIPKEIFENMFFQEGGEKLHKALTGEYIFEDESGEPNSELEGGEYLEDSEGIRQVDGEKHASGGVALDLQEGTRIISDFLKIGAKDAKKINEEYDLNVKASDTYATVLDKFGKKSGLTKINEELEEHIAKLEEQQKETKDETTLALNTQYLTEEINEGFKEKEPLEKQRELLFDTLFEMQESSKKEEEDKKNFQTGGTMTYNGDTVVEIGKKHGISVERAKELLSNFKVGGELPQYQGAGVTPQPEDIDRGNIYSPLNPNNPLFFGNIPQPITNQRVSNVYEKEKYGHQKPNKDWKDFGDLNKNEQAAVLADIGRVFPTLASKFLKNGVPANTKDFQKAINDHYDSIKEDAKKLYPQGSKELETFLQSVDKERFSIPSNVKNFKGLVTDIDNKFGDYTSTRPNFAFDVLPKDVLTEVKNSGVNTASELKEVFPQYYKKYVEPKGLTSDFWLDTVAQPVNGKTTPQPQVPVAPIGSPISVTPTAKPANTGFLNLPRSYTLPPSGQTQYMRQVAQASTIDPVFISPERQLAEISRQTQAAQNNISMLPDQQAAAAMSSVSANAADAANKAISDVNRYNAQAQESANRFNAQLTNTTQREQNQLDLTYKNLTEAAKDKTEQDWRNYFNKLSAEDVDRWKTTFAINFENARNPYIQYTPQGYQVTAPDIANNAAVRRLMSAADTPTENLPIKKEAVKKTIPKKKTGGRFKK